MDFSQAIESLGGGVSAVVIIGLVLWGRGREKRSDDKYW